MARRVDEKPQIPVDVPNGQNIWNLQLIWNVVHFWIASRCLKNQGNPALMTKHVFSYPFNFSDDSHQRMMVPH